MADAPALDRETIERAAPSAERPLLIALSGGGDSTALLHMLHDQLGAACIAAVVIDHALRDGSAEDAARAAAFAYELGVATMVVRLAWPDGPRRAQADARDARYGALCDLARDMGAAAIALGHTRDDQAETVLMRAARQSAWRGLAGMRAWAPAPVWPEGRGLSIARPLLHARRDALRVWLRARGAPWIEDPANANPAFARVRARTRLAQIAQAGLDPMRLAALAECLAPHAQALDRAAAALIAGGARFEEDCVSLDLGAWSAAAASVRARALGALIAAASGAARAPDAEQIAALGAKLAAPDFTAATLGGALIRRTGAALVLRRDPGALVGRADGAAAPGPVLLPPGREAVWDGRAALHMRQAGWSVMVEAGEPVLAKGAARRPLAAAAPRWLLAEHAAHVLGA